MSPRRVTTSPALGCAEAGTEAGTARAATDSEGAAWVTLWGRAWRWAPRHQHPVSGSPGSEEAPGLGGAWGVWRPRAIFEGQLECAEPSPSVSSSYGGEDPVFHPSPVDLGKIHKPWHISCPSFCYTGTGGVCAKDFAYPLAQSRALRPGLLWGAEGGSGQGVSHFWALSSHLTPLRQGEGGRRSPVGTWDLHQCFVEGCSPRGEGWLWGGSSSVCGHGQVNHPDLHLGTEGGLWGKAALFLRVVVAGHWPDMAKQVSGCGLPPGRENRVAKLTPIPPPAAMAGCEGDESPGSLAEAQSPLPCTAAPGHAAGAAAPRGFGDTWGCWGPVTAPKVRGSGKGPAPTLVQLHGQGWQSSPERTGPPVGPAPTAGLGTLGVRVLAHCHVPAPTQESSSPCTCMSGRARPSLPGWVTMASPRGHQEWATGTLVGQCPATTFSSFALGTPWPPQPSQV